MKHEKKMLPLNRETYFYKTFLNYLSLFYRKKHEKKTCLNFAKVTNTKYVCKMMFYYDDVYFIS